MSNILIFYLKDDSKNIELAKEVWLDNLNCGNYTREKYYKRYFLSNDKIIIKNNIYLKN